MCRGLHCSSQLQACKFRGLLQALNCIKLLQLCRTHDLSTQQACGMQAGRIAAQACTQGFVGARRAAMVMQRICNKLSPMLEVYIYRGPRSGLHLQVIGPPHCGGPQHSHSLKNPQIAGPGSVHRYNLLCSVAQQVI